MSGNVRITRRQFLRAMVCGTAGMVALSLLEPHFLHAALSESGEGAQAATPIPAAAPFDFSRRTVTLKNGMEMPIFGLGTYTLMNGVVKPAVYEALMAGYRLIDTAAAYGNEWGVGQGVQQAGVPREEIFITSKLWPTNVAMKDVDRRLDLLEMDYIDLLLLHQPYGDYLSAYRTMEEAVRQGKVRALGLSNFSATQVEDVMAHAEIQPVLLQVETHLHNQQKLTAQYLRLCGIALQGWSPLGGRPNTDTFLQDETVRAMAADYGKTSAQIILRWHLQTGHLTIPGSGNPEHIRENIQAFDFQLADADVERLNALDQKAPYFPEMGGTDEDTLEVMKKYT